MHQCQKELIPDESLGKTYQTLNLDAHKLPPHYMIHLHLDERIRLLLYRIYIAISILCLRTICCVVSFIVALEADDLTQVLPHWCRVVGTVLISVSSISISSISIPWATMIVSMVPMLRMASMIMMAVPSNLVGADPPYPENGAGRGFC